MKAHKVERKIYSVFGSLASVHIIVGASLAQLFHRFPEAKYSEDRKEFTVFQGGQRIVYRKK